MKKHRKSFLFTIISILVSSFLASCGSSATKTSRAWLDLYQESMITFDGLDDPSLLSWTSANENVVTVENAKLIAQGVGETTVSSSGEGSKYQIDVKVFDSGSLPSIKVENTVFYVGVSHDISPYIFYNGESYYPNLEYDVRIDNSNVATSNGTKITGISEGLTNARIKTKYKGNDISRSFILTIKPNSYVELIENNEPIDAFTLYASSNQKFSSKVLDFNLIDNGEKISNPEMKYEVEDTSIVSFTDNTIFALKEGKTNIHASYAAKSSISLDFVVNVKPNYVEGSFSNDVSANYGTTYTPYSGKVGTRSGNMMKFYNGDTMHNDEKESYWHHRLINDHAGTNAIDAYRNYGFRYFAFDIYMEKEAWVLLLLDGLSTTFYVPYDTYFQNDIVKVIDEDGNYINKFVKQQWLTVVYDIKARIEFEPDSTLNCYLALNADGLTSYLMNIRYYMDSSFLPYNPLQYSRISEDELQASNDEFVKLHNNSNTYKKIGKTVDGVSNPHLYKTSSSSYLQDSLVIASSTGSSKSDSIIRLKEKGNYLAFDLYLEKASSLYFSINNKRLFFNADVGVTNFINSKWISLFSNNKIEYEINLNKWYTVFIDFASEEMVSSYLKDPNTADPVFIEFNSCDKDDVLYINNVRYLQTKNIVPSEYAKPMIVSDKSSIIVNKNEVFDINASIINGTKPGDLKYEIANESIVSKTLGESKFKASSVGLTSIKIVCEDLLPISVDVRVIDEYDYPSSSEAYYRDAGMSGLDSYAIHNHLTVSRDNKEMVSSSIIRFDFKVIKPISFLYLLDTAGFGDASLNATRIGPNEYKGAEWWGAPTKGADASILSIADSKGNVLGKYNKEGIEFETGKTYSVYYALSSGRSIDIFVSNLGLTKAKEDFYWGNSDYSYLSKVTDYIEVSNIGGVYSDITPVISTSKTNQKCYLNKVTDLEFDTIFGNNKQITYEIADESVLTIENGKIHPKKVGSTSVRVSVEGGNSITVNIDIIDGYINLNEHAYIKTIGEEIILNNEVLESSSIKNITYSSSDDSIVSVSGNKLTLLKMGFVLISAKAPECEDKQISVRVLQNDKTKLNDEVVIDSDYPGGQRMVFNKNSTEASKYDTIELDITVKESFSYLYLLDKYNDDPNYAQYENGVKIGDGISGNMYQGLTSWWVPNFTAGFDASRLSISKEGKVLGLLGKNPSSFNRVGEGFAFEKGKEYKITIDLSNNHSLIILLANFMKNPMDGNDHDEVCGGNIGNYMLKVTDYILINDVYGINKRS